MDSVGIEALTMRGLAGAMGIAPMTLYRHVPDKHSLLALLPDALLADVAREACRKRRALPALRAIAYGLADVLQEHPGSAALFTQPESGPHMRHAAEHVTGLLVAEGLTPDQANVALRATVAQAVGEVLTMHGAVDLGGVDLLLEGVQARLTSGKAP
ncbi:MAG: hypothetical protein RLZ94_2277 [Actinomycetota bacterium]|jgi:AcrR family transcriptional regulator